MNGFRTGALGVIYDILSVCTNPEVNFGGLGASLGPGDGVNISFLYNFSKKSGVCAAKKNLSEILLPVSSKLRIT